MLDAVPQFLGVLQVFPGDVRNALRVHVGEPKLRVEGQRRQDGQLVGSVDSLHVESGIGFGKAEFLRLGQRLGEGGALFPHRGQDVVGSAVDDASQRAHPIGSQA